MDLIRFIDRFLKSSQLLSQAWAKMYVLEGDLEDLRSHYVRLANDATSVLPGYSPLAEAAHGMGGLQRECWCSRRERGLAPEHLDVDRDGAGRHISERLDDIANALDVSDHA